MSPFNRKNNLIQTYSLIIIDIVCVLISYVIAYYIRYQGTQHMGQVDFVLCLLLVLFCVLYGFLLDWNHFIFKRGYFEELIAVLKYTISMTVMLGFSVFLIRQGEAFSRLVFGVFAIFDIILTYIAQTAFKKYLYHFYKRSTSSDKVMLVTTHEYALQLLKDVKKEAEWSYEITGIALLNDEVSEKEIEGIPIVASGAKFFEDIKQNMMDAAFLYLPDFHYKRVNELIEIFETMGVTCYYSIGNLNRKKSVQSVGTFAGHLVITYESNTIDYRRQFIKRFFDIVGGIIGMIFTMLLTPFIALAIKIDSKGPVFFAQTRIGRNGRRFSMYKFRSMYIDAEERKKELLAQNEMQGLMFKMEHDPRITRVGKFLRKTSLDELPQFINVLKGDMSLVGTRPPTIDEFEQYNLRYRRRLSITPGLTGMWQVSGRSDITNFEDVVKLDLAYIDNWSLTLDLKIMLQTVGVVLFGRGSK